MSETNNILDNLFFDKRSYRQLYKLKDEGKLDYEYVTVREKSFIIMDKDEKIYLFLLNPISVNFQNVIVDNEKKDRIISNIYSSIQIEEYFQALNISNPIVVGNGSKKNFSNAKINIESFIKDNKLTIYNDTSDFAKFESNIDNDMINSNKFKPKNLSKYFFKYFLYNKENNEDEFEYDYTENRKNFISSFLDVLIYTKDLHFFKFCGPSSTGKSTTLLKFSRQHKKIIYLNLKTINTLEKENNFEHYNLIIYEFRKLYFDTKDNENNFLLMLINDCQNKPATIIILKILNFIKNENYIIIFDQFKKKYVNKADFEEIENLIKSSKLKLIMCSSIDDKDVRKEVIKTIEYFRGNPKELNNFTQDYYFYIRQNFFKKKISKNIELNRLLQLFDNKPKYQYLLSQSKEHDHFTKIKDIKSHIIEKMKDFFSFEPDFDLCKILLNIKNKIGLKFDYSEFSNVIQKVPMKYYTLELEEKSFEINYAFNYMKFIEKEEITQEECNNYFLNKKYELDKSLDGKVKGEYFEMSARFFMECKNVLPTVINHKISVKNIVGMEMLINEENDIGKIIYNSNYDLPQMEIKAQEKINEEIEIIEKILEKDNIENKVMLDEKYENKKNIEYYLVNQALDVKVINEKKKVENENSLLQNKRKRLENIDQKKDELKKKVLKKDLVGGGFPKKNKSKKGKSKKDKPKKEDLKKEEPKKEESKKEESKKEESKEKERYYIKDIDDTSILINQVDANGKTLDQAFIYGKKDNKILIGLQMKCLSDKVDHYNTLKNINKDSIKQNCQSILLRSKFDLNIQIKQWHYIIIAYYNKDEKDNIYCKQLERHCKKQDLEIFYFNPLEQKLYDKQFKVVKKIQISNRSNPDYDFPESNPYNVIYNEETNDLINSYYEDRIEKLNNKKNYYEQKSIEDFFTDWLKEININIKDLENELKFLCNCKQLKQVDYFKLNDNFMIPSPNKGYIFVFKNKNKTDLVCYYHKDKLRAKNLGNKNDIIILELPIYIDTKEKNFIVFKF